MAPRWEHMLPCGRLRPAENAALCFMPHGGPVTDDRYSEKETEERLRKALAGAFRGPPTPLKDIPKRGGESRKVKAASASAATSKSARPKP